MTTTANTSEAKYAHRMRVFTYLKAGDIISRRMIASEREGRNMPLVENMTNYFLMMRVVRKERIGDEVKIEVEPIHLEDEVSPEERTLVTTGRYATIRRRGVYITARGYASQPHLRFKNNTVLMGWLRKQYRYGLIPTVTTDRGTGEE